LAATLDFTSFFTMAFLGAAHFFYSWAVFGLDNIQHSPTYFILGTKIGTHVDYHQIKIFENGGTHKFVHGGHSSGLKMMVIKFHHFSTASILIITISANCHIGKTLPAKMGNIWTKENF